MSLKQEEIKKIYEDIYTYHIPKRLPISAQIHINVFYDLYKMHPTNRVFDYSLFEKVVDDFCEKYPQLDVCPFTRVQMTMTRLPASYELLGSNNFIMNSEGMMQHPEVNSMEDNEYTEFIKDPYAFILDKCLPRAFTSLAKGPVDAANYVSMARASEKIDQASVNSWLPKIIDKYEFYKGAPAGSSSKTYLPADYFADHIRGFTGFSIDIRRHRQEMIEAIDALVPIIVKSSMPSNPDILGSVIIPTHMPAFMRPKDFEEVYLPSALKVLREYAANGVKANIVCERDWSHVTDIVYDTFPEGLQLSVEGMSPEMAKEKLGDKFIIGNCINGRIIRYSTKQECIDTIKKSLDILMSGGNYVFGFNESLLAGADLVPENYQAVLDTVLEYGQYGSDAGKSTGIVLNREGYKHDPSTEFYSTRAFDWEKFKEKNPYVPEFARERFEKLYDDEFLFNTNLLT